MAFNVLTSLQFLSRTFFLGPPLRMVSSRVPHQEGLLLLSFSVLPVRDLTSIWTDPLCLQPRPFPCPLENSSWLLPLISLINRSQIRHIFFSHSSKPNLAYISCPPHPCQWRSSLGTSCTNHQSGASLEYSLSYSPYPVNHQRLVFLFLKNDSNISLNYHASRHYHPLPGLL